MSSYLVTVTVTDPDTGKYSIEIHVQAKTTAHAKRIAYKPQGRWALAISQI